MIKLEVTSMSQHKHRWCMCSMASCCHVWCPECGAAAALPSLSHNCVAAAEITNCRGMPASIPGATWPESCGGAKVGQSCNTGCDRALSCGSVKSKCASTGFWTDAVGSCSGRAHVGLLLLCFAYGCVLRPSQIRCCKCGPHSRG